MRHKGNL